VELKIQTGSVDVSKLDTIIKEDKAIQRRSSMTSNEMAKDMHKGEFISSMNLLDQKFVTQMSSGGLTSKKLNGRTATAFINRRMRTKLTSAKTPMMQKNEWFHRKYGSKVDMKNQRYAGSIERLEN
jgi:hypothetical protein